jgi:hypothetical protein
VLQFRATKNLRVRQCFRLFIMSSRKVIIKGMTYVRSRDAARVVSLAPDYVSRLARMRLIAGQLVQNVWFVNLASLHAFIDSQNRAD